jgi:hypothetical protein
MEVFNPPKHLKAPTMKVINNDYNAAFEKLNQDEKQYIEDLKAFLINRKKGKYVGKLVQFPVADGTAKYMVASVRPLELVHIPFDDEYQFQYIFNLKWADILNKIKQEEALDKLFNRQKS